MAPRKFGTVRQTGEGKWSARYQYAGKKYSSPEPFLKESHAAAWLEKERGLIRDGDWTPPSDRAEAKKVATLTVAELVDLWLQGDFKESTVQSHRRKLNSRVLRESFDGFDSLADVPVVEVDRKRIQLWWSQVITCWPEQKSTNSSAYKRLHTAFEHAVHELEIISDNPVKVKGASRVPRSQNRDRPLISLAEAKALAENTSPRLRVGVLVLLWSGLRIGELLELRRKDLVGLAKKDEPVTVKVRRNVQRMTDTVTKKQVMVSLSTPKTEAGNRDIVLPSSVSEALREHAREFMASGAEALVITTQTGAQMMDTNFRNRFNRAAELAGRPDITPHDCRRFYSTRLVSPDHESGRGAPVSLEEARRLMGHETIEQLMEYQRAADGYENRAAEALEEALTRAGSEKDD
ncbi:site-specific integrase [Corynebacterium sp. SCR221107]|uniref:tyrosine-type recombinase/integrase n=1 Tax=Corynebacterium sp. SCR221107 TaxID=3017361 RepID=UPI0022EC4887|nr:site-specific integrase [Corynebacterium sp. SCR221107]WBT08116.1 site-specific integrase [Corynebacterium sp. SCR221107]